MRTQKSKYFFKDYIGRQEGQQPLKITRMNQFQDSEQSKVKSQYISEAGAAKTRVSPTDFSSIDFTKEARKAAHFPT